MVRQQYSSNFEKLWNAFDPEYGEKGSKKLAYKVFTAMSLTDGDVEYILARYEVQRAIKAIQRRKGEFFATFQHVERYLKNERFDDEINLSDATRRRTAQSKTERADEAARIALLRSQ